MRLDFALDGICVGENVLPRKAIDEAARELFKVVRILTETDFDTLDAAWNYLKVHDREKGALLYNAAKLCPQMHAIAGCTEMLSKLRVLGVDAPAVIDVNFRIDTRGEEAYLFGWHQDYWFSVCSPNAVVAWIPLTRIDCSTGGVELISRRISGNKIYKARRGDTYNSYADAAVLDESVPDAPAIRCAMNVGDVLFFKFDVLHRSVPIAVEDKSRWTLQIRYADLNDPEFRNRSFKPSSVNQNATPFLKND